jgi:hypothetical protein
LVLTLVFGLVTVSIMAKALLRARTRAPRSAAAAPCELNGNSLIAAGSRGLDQFTGSGRVPELGII